MNILYISYFYPPHSAIGSTRAYLFSCALARRGHDVTVVGVDPPPARRDTTRFSDWRAPAGGRVSVIRTGAIARAMDTLREELIDQTAPETTAAPDGADSASPLRAAASALIDQLRFNEAVPEPQVTWNPEAVIGGLTATLRGRPDVILVSGRPFATFYAGAAIKLLTGAPLLLDLRDPWSPMSEPGSLEQRATRAQEKLLFGIADAVVLNTEASLQAYRAAYRSPIREKFTRLRNAIADYPETFGPPEGSEAPFLLLYGGNLYNRSLTPLLKAFQKMIRRRDLSPDEARLRLIGRFDAGAFDAKDVEALGEHLEISGFLPYQKFAEQVEAASAMLIPIGDYDMCIPGKFYECLADGKPMLFLSSGPHELADIIEDELGVGVAVCSDDPDAICRGLERLRLEILPELRENPPGRETLRPFHIDARCEQLEALLLRISA